MIYTKASLTLKSVLFQQTFEGKEMWLHDIKLTKIVWVIRAIPLYAY